jgi:ribonuclease PH
MFKCNFCGDTTKPKEKQTKITVEWKIRHDGSATIKKQANACVACARAHTDAPKPKSFTTVPLFSAGEE